MQIKIPEAQEQLVKRLERNCKGIGLECVLHGGYLRDTYFGVSPKDFDLFVCVSEADVVYRNIKAIADYAVKNPQLFISHFYIPSAFHYTVVGNATVVKMSEFVYSFSCACSLFHGAQNTGKVDDVVINISPALLVMMQFGNRYFCGLTPMFSFCGIQAEVEFLEPMNGESPESVVEARSKTFDYTINMMYYLLTEKRLYIPCDYTEYDLENRILRSPDLNLIRTRPNYFFRGILLVNRYGLSVEQELDTCFHEHASSVCKQMRASDLVCALKSDIGRGFNAKRGMELIDNYGALRAALGVDENRVFTFQQASELAQRIVDELGLTGTSDGSDVYDMIRDRLLCSL